MYFKESTENEGGRIVNSYKVQNPTVVIGYSIHLRFFSDSKDCFDGSAAGIAAEWIVHNVGYDLTYVPSKFGVLETTNIRAADADIGRTIFNEDDLFVILPSLVVQASLNHKSIIYDYYQYVTQEKSDQDG